MQSFKSTRFDDRPKRFALVLLTGLVVLIVAALSLKPAWRKLRTYRVERFIARAMEAREVQDWDAVAINLRAANRLDPQHPEPIRETALYYSRFNNPDGLPYWVSLEQRNLLTPEERILWAKLALSHRRLDQARTALKPLHEREPRNAEILLLLSQWYELAGNVDQAINTALDALTYEPGNEAAELRVGALELLTEDFRARQAGKARLFALITGGSVQRGEAALVLFLNGRLKAGEETLLRQLLAGGGESFQERLVRLLLAIQREPSTMVALVRGFLERGGGSPEELGAAAEALGRAGRMDAVVEIISEDLALQHPNLARLRLGALAALGEAEKMQSLLEHPAKPIPARTAYMFQASLARLLGRTNEMTQLWELALANSRGNPFALESLAVHAEQVGELSVAATAWEQLLLDPVQAGRAAERLLRLAQDTRDPRTIHAALNRLVDLQPGHQPFQLALAFYRLLIEVNVPQAEATLQELAGRFQAEGQFHVAAALAALRRKEPELAVTSLEHPSIDWPNAPVTWRIVQAAAIGQAGQFSLARKLTAGLLAGGLEPAKLSAPEFALLKDWLPEGSPK